MYDITSLLQRYKMLVPKHVTYKPCKDYYIRRGVIPLQKQNTYRWNE